MGTVVQLLYGSKGYDLLGLLTKSEGLATGRCQNAGMATVTHQGAGKLFQPGLHRLKLRCRLIQQVTNGLPQVMIGLFLPPTKWSPRPGSSDGFALFVGTIDRCLCVLHQCTLIRVEIGLNPVLQRPLVGVVGHDPCANVIEPVAVCKE